MTTMTSIANVQTPAANWIAANATSNSFASSLLNQYLRKGSLSEKQWAAADRAAKRDAMPKADTANVTLPNIAAHLRTASDKLKNPKVTIEGLEFKLMTAGNHAGTIFISRGYWGSGIGKITSEGSLITYRSFEPEHLTTITKIEADPKGVIAKSGKDSGQCCYCALPLTDDRSLHVGYGPVCAKNYALPYPKGKISKKAAEVAA
jgi:hypothetical protein